VNEATGKTVLIVEDDPDVAEAAKIVLEGAGYRTQLAANAADGKEQVRRVRPDLILLDVMMPAGTEGFHFVWDLRKEEDAALQATPVIVMTALHRTTKLRFYPEQSDSVYQPFEYLPVQGFLDKPVAPTALLAAVERALSEAAESGR